MSVDPYLIPGTDVLRNIRSITGPAILAEFEFQVSSLRISELEAGHGLPGRFDLAHLQAVHRYLYQDAYDWAGEIRTVAMSKGTDFHPLPQVLYAQEMFERLSDQDFLRGLDREVFVARKPAGVRTVRSAEVGWWPQCGHEPCTVLKRLPPLNAMRCPVGTRLPPWGVTEPIANKASTTSRVGERRLSRW